MSVVSVGLSGLPFISSCDSTRIQMAAKQINQSLTSLNCEIPYVICKDYKNLTNSSNLGICIAKEDGKVLFKSDNNIIVYYYTDSDKLEVKKINTFKKTYGEFCSQLRNCLNEGDEFKAGDIIYEYDNFITGIPTFGYNVFTAYCNFFGYNHEDSIICSESFVNRTKVQYIDKLYIPIFDYTMFHPIYSDLKDSYNFFPSVGQKLENGVFAVKILPKRSSLSSIGMNEMKSKMLNTIKSMGLSDFLNIKNINTTTLSDGSVIKSKIHNGIVTDIKVHNVKLNTNINLIDTKLYDLMNILNRRYLSNIITPDFNKLKEIFTEDYSCQILKQHYVYTDDYNFDNLFRNCIYLLEVEITGEDSSEIGDKFANRYANKGVVSHILPDELRPLAIESNTPVDLIYSPFSVFSRMNVSQILEAIVSKNIWMCDKFLKSYPNKQDAINSLNWINNNIITHFNDKEYYNNVNNLINNLDKDTNLYNKFMDNIKEYNLFIEAPSFNKINTKQIFNNSIPINEDLFLSKKLLNYMSQNLKLNSKDLLEKNFKGVIVDNKEGIILKNILCAPVYISKLYKLVSHLINSRDIGQVSTLNKQPTRGRAVGGGSRLGQMELEAFIAHGTTNVLKEFMTVKSDHEESKNDLIDQLIRTMKYDFNLKNESTNLTGGSKKVVSELIKFLEE